MGERRDQDGGNEVVRKAKSEGKERGRERQRVRERGRKEEREGGTEGERERERESEREREREIDWLLMCADKDHHDHLPGGVLKQTIVGVEHLMGQKEEPLPVGKQS